MEIIASKQESTYKVPLTEPQNFCLYFFKESVFFKVYSAITILAPSKHDFQDASTGEPNGANACEEEAT